MDIADAATFFDDDPVLDGYSGLSLFNAQTASFDDSSSDGATNRRRVLSTGPDVVMPTRQVIRMYGDRWVVGIGTPDGFQGSPVRQHFTMKRVTNLATVLTPGQLLLGSTPLQAYIHKNYFKEVVNALTNADTDNYWNVFAAPGEPIARGKFLRLDDEGIFLRVRNDYLPVEGLRVCQSDQLDTGALTTAVFNTGTFDRITDTTSGGTTTVAALQIEPSKFYHFEHMSDPSFQKGDLVVLVPSSLSATMNQQFTMGGKRWRVMSVQAEQDAKALHARLA